MSNVFELTRDEAGQVSYGLSISNAKVFGIAGLVANTNASIDLSDEDKYAIFFPALGQDYYVSSQELAPDGGYTSGVFTQGDAFLNIAHIGLDNWPIDLASAPLRKRLNIISPVALTMTIYIGQKV